MKYSIKDLEKDTYRIEYASKISGVCDQAGFNLIILAGGDIKALGSLRTPRPT